MDSAQYTCSSRRYSARKKVPRISPPSRIRYARVPRQVYADPRLEARGVRIYCVLASACWQGSVAQVGKRLIATEACCAECTVISSLRKLEAAGHTQKQPGRRRGHRAMYVLLSPVFGQKQRAGVEEVISGQMVGGASPAAEGQIEMFPNDRPDPLRRAGLLYCAAGPQSASAV